MAALQRSDRNPINYLKNECDLENWEWIDEFQSKRSLSLLGMNKNANWIKYTSLKNCDGINTFFNINQDEDVVGVGQRNKENINTTNC